MENDFSEKTFGNFSFYLMYVSELDFEGLCTQEDKLPYRNLSTFLSKNNTIVNW